MYVKAVRSVPVRKTRCLLYAYVSVLNDHDLLFLLECGHSREKMAVNSPRAFGTQLLTINNDFLVGVLY